MKSKLILSALLATAFIFVFGSLSWADNYRSEHHRHYYGDKHRYRYDPKPPRYYPKTHYQKPGPKVYPRYYGRHYPPPRNSHIHKKHAPIYKPYYRYNYYKGYPFYPYRYRPYPPVYFGNGFYFGTSIFEPGLFMTFSINGR